ncbi:MAG: cupin domain-containing protein [Acutalibacteraceae bacterium]
MIIVSTNNPKGVKVEGEYSRFIASFLSANLQPQVHGFSIGMVILPPGGKSEPHSHKDAQECWYVIEGSATAIIGDEKGIINKGDILYGPENVTHTLINRSSTEPFKALLILCPGGDERNVTDVLLKNGGVMYEP